MQAFYTAQRIRARERVAAGKAGQLLRLSLFVSVGSLDSVGNVGQTLLVRPPDRDCGVRRLKSNSDEPVAGQFAWVEYVHGTRTKIKVISSGLAAASVPHG